jgi:hypothetical protein
MCGGNSVLGKVADALVGGGPSSKTAEEKSGKFDNDAAAQFQAEAAAAPEVAAAAREEAAQGEAMLGSGRATVRQGMDTVSEGREIVGQGRSTIGEGQEIRRQAQQEYGTQAGLRDQMISEGTITPGKLDVARSGAMADVAAAYRGAKSARDRSNAAMGINPGDPGAQGGDNAASVGLAAAQVGTGNAAALAERKYRTEVGATAIGQEQARQGIASTAEGVGGSIVGAGAGLESAGFAGQGVGYGAQTAGAKSLASATSGLMGAGRMYGESGSGLEKIGAAQTQLQAGQEQQQTSLIPTFSLSRGGKISRMGFRPSVMRTHDGRIFPTRTAVAQGQISGPGTGTSDGVEAHLSDGEYVQTAKSTKAIGPRTLDTLTEIGHRAATGDPKGAKHLKRVVRAIHGAGFRAPERVAGKEPRPARTSVQAQWGGQNRGRGTIGAPHGESRVPTTVKDGGFRPEKVGTVMHEFKAGTLHSGKNGPAVTNSKQAIAIALSEKRRAEAVHGGLKRRGRGFRAADGGSMPWLQDASDAVAAAPPSSGKSNHISLKPKLRRGGTVRAADGGGYLDQTDINVVPGMNAEESIAGAKNQQSLMGNFNGPNASRPSVNIGGGNQHKGNHIKISEAVKLAAMFG